MSREWYPWFPHRFWTSERVVLMDDAAIALYKFLLDHEWENGPFSSDVRVIRAICARFKSFDTSWPQVLPCFAKNAQGKLYNERMERERDIEQQAAHERAARSRSAWTRRRDAVGPVLRADAEQVQSTCRASAEHAQSKCRADAEQVQSTQHAPTYRPTDLPTDRQTDQPTEGAGGPAPEDASLRSAGAPRDSGGGRKRKSVPKVPWVGTIPIALDTPEFHAAWARWIAHRAGGGKGGRVTQRSGDAALELLAEWGPEEAVRAIRYSIANNYQGVTPAPKPRDGGGRPTRAPTQDERNRAALERMAAWAEDPV